MSKIFGQHLKGSTIDMTVFSMVINGTGSDPTKGTVNADFATWSRDGDCMLIHYDLFTNGTGTAGSGIYLFNIPVGYSIDYSKLSNQGSTEVLPVVGVAEANISSSNGTGHMIAFNSTQLIMATTNATVGNGGTAPVGSSNYTMSQSITFSFWARIPIVGWDANDVLRISDNSKV